ncbi:peptidoglycan D,D-transpeptidase FtsI family protein [Kineococcus sp. SYSU DK001]|uniref:peptidoglycan D,D-transpeptidase FtsI family protein n=1 Tax=Kineococcus sp. SYSU DK001 TaxID=3383122 RepID=UPI003D7DAE44
MRVYTLGVLGGLTVLGGRLVQLQGADASQLAKDALDQRTSTTTLYAKRGDILDSSGVVLATSVERRDVIADPLTIGGFNLRNGKPYKEGRGTGPEGAAALLAPVLGIDPATLTAKLTGTNRYAVVAVGITPQLWQQVSDLGISGITSQRQTQRIYPTGAASSTLVGILGTPEETEAGEFTDHPLSGLEMARNSLLVGTDGWMRYERSAGGQEIPLGDSETAEPVDGTSLHLTIDSDLQWKAQSAIAAKVAETGAESGTVVIMDRQQRLLALASAPSLDPTNLVGLTNDQLQNTALTKVFEPGSTAKVVTLAAALEEGVVTADSRFTVPGELVKYDKAFHDSHEHGDEKLTLAGILAVSSNIGTILAGEKLNADLKTTSTILHDYHLAFGFGAKTTLKFPGESAGILGDPAKYSGTQRYTVMFGQGLSVTAVQAASVFATIANDGVRVEPTLIAGTSDPDGNYRAEPGGQTSRVVSATTAKTLRDMMQSVVSEAGTAAAAEIPGYLVAGKTGTANRYDVDLGRYDGYTASFIGLAPADDPELVVAVILQDPKTNYYGGSAAGPVFKDVMTYALARRGVAPSAEPPADLPLTWGGDEAAEQSISTGAVGDTVGQ